MLKIISFNANGIRAASRKSFFSWLEAQDAGIICIQETKAQEHQLKDELFRPDGYHAYFFDAEKPGYSGVAIYTKYEPEAVSVGLGWEIADREGRYIQIDYPTLSVASLYMPSGTSGEHRQAVKFEFLDHYAKHLKKLLNEKRDYIICGDWNIAHTKMDLKNWQSNQKTSGFLPEERAWMDMIFNDLGYVDAFRVVNQEPDQYTWWSSRSKTAFENNVGWRIDYQVITPGLKDKVRSASICREKQFSDHAPLTLVYDLSL